ncbi:TolC family protein [Adhaeribacter soli]|uniref:TolC family protein n=1 Tax=Adhaeribacter soli TaxID=2607655 RepID=A0A5N1IMN4_9BACT|nr:TolC family protein [Adhaeribacter soli]KAA9326004.1 TolC family protein [Adhaeribacter soli]
MPPKKKINNPAFLLLAFALGLLLFPARNAMAQAEKSALVFTLDAFFEQILQHHPVAKQAALLPEQARQEIRVARGQFDPSLNSYYSSKEFTGKNYYRLWDSNLKIPTWFGPELKAGFEDNSGIYLNPQNTVPEEGLLYAGLSVPIGQGLLIDQRRAALRQAKLATGMLEAERIKTINKLLLQAAKDYWDWYFAFQQRELYLKGLQFANVRRQAVGQRAASGDLAAIDTVEAAIEVKKREVTYQEAEVQFQNARLLVSNYLWQENLEPVELPENAIPADYGSALTPLSADSLQRLLEQAQTRHPDLLKLQLKNQQLEYDRRVQADKFKPKLNAEYYLLQRRLAPNPEYFANGYLLDNYKFGLSFSYPLLLRAERGKYQLMKLKLLDNNLETQQTRREVLNQVQAAYNQWQTLEQQLQRQEQLVQQSQLLRDAEQALFEAGESSLFLTNSREMSLLTNEIKLYELKAKYAKNKTFLQWAAGSIR